MPLGRNKAVLAELHGFESLKMPLASLGQPDTTDREEITMERSCIAVGLMNAFLISAFANCQELQVFSNAWSVKVTSGVSSALLSGTTQLTDSALDLDSGGQTIRFLQTGREDESGVRYLALTVNRPFLFSSAGAATAGQTESRTSKAGDDYSVRLKNVMALWKMGKAREAAHDVAELVKTDPSRWEGYALAGVIEEGINNDSAAKVVYERALILAPEADKPRLRKALEQLGVKSNVMAMCDSDRPATAAPCATPPSFLGTPASIRHDDAGKHHLDGSVLLKVVIGEDGTTRNCRVIKSSDAVLDDAAIATVTQWKFTPGTYQSKPVPVEIDMELILRLDATVAPNSTLLNGQVGSPSASKQTTTPPKR
jgi:TonB family protein